MIIRGPAWFDSGCLGTWTAAFAGRKPRPARPGSLRERGLRPTGPQVQGRAGPGRFPQEAKAACRRRQALPGCCAALPKYKTIVTAWRLRQLLKGRRRESKPPFKRQERFFPAGGFLEVTSTAAGMRLLLCAAAGAPGLSPCRFFPSRQAAGRFLNVGTFPFGSRSSPPLFCNFPVISSTASPAGPFFLCRQKEGKERPGLRPGPGRPKASVA